MHVDIVIQTEDGARQVRRLNADGVISVGRSPRSVLYLESDLVSRQHILVGVNDRGTRVEDTSTNGTLAGATLLRRSSADVPFGTPIIVGNYTLVFQPADGTSDRPPPSNPTIVSLEGAEQLPTAPPRQASPRATLVTTSPPSKMAPPPPPRPSANSSVRPPPPPRSPSKVDASSQAGASQNGPSAPKPRKGAAANASTMLGLGASSNAPSGAPPPAHASGAPPALASGVEAGLGARVASGVELSPSPGADAETALRRELHRQLVEQVGPSALDPARAGEPALRVELLTALRRLSQAFGGRLPQGVDAESLAAELVEEALGLGPLDDLLNDPSVEEIFVVDSVTIYVEREGRRERVNARFTDEDWLLVVLSRLLAPAGVRVDGPAPFVEASLEGGLHVHAALPPLSARGPSVTLRKLARAPLSLERLVRAGALDEAVARFLSRSVAARKNILVCGGQGSGKTALLGALAATMGHDERVVTVEEAGELGLVHPHVVSLVGPPADSPDPSWSPRALLRQARRMRPERIVLGACVGDEAFEFLRALHAGCDGSMTSVYAHTPREALARFEALARLGSPSTSAPALRYEIASALHLVVQQTRYQDGSRRVSAVSEVSGVDPQTGEVLLADIFRFECTGSDGTGRVVGSFRPTGHLPSFLPVLVEQGFVDPGGPPLLV